MPESGQIIQIAKLDELVIRSATDYIRHFVAKMPFVRVIRVASIMANESTYAAGLSIPADTANRYGFIFS